MQVFLPYPDVSKSVRCLDKSRLGNQVWREAKTLLNGGWKHHPVAVMWKEYRPLLALYCLNGLDELMLRRHLDPSKLPPLLDYFTQIFNESPVIYPPWFGNEEFHRSHRLNLLFKYPQWYSKYRWEKIPSTKPDYYWPLQERK